MKFFALNFFRFLFFGSILVSQFAFANGTALSPSGLEGVLTYKAVVHVPQGVQPTDANLASLINYQIKHLLGVMEAPAFAKWNGLPANSDLGPIGLGAVESFKVMNTEKDGDGLDVTYWVRHRVLALKKALSPGQARDLKIILPHDPVALYARECTDEQYYQKEYFFYYWNPFKPVCRARLTGKNQVEQITAHLEGRNPPPVTVSPDYKALNAQIRARGELRISLLFGFDEASTHPDDEGRVSYNYFLDYFTKKDGFEIDRRQNIPTGPFAELIRQGDGKHPTVHVSMSVSASDINNPVVFARRAREAFETSDIVMYVGHSGLGGNLDLDKLTRLSSPNPAQPAPIRFPRAYQIIFIDSCASYYFYSQQYVLAKQGARYVDLVSNGLAALFASQNAETLNFLNHFIDPQGAATWMQILTDTERAAKGLTYMVNVSPVR